MNAMNAHCPDPVSNQFVRFDFWCSVNTPLRLGRVTEKPLAHALHCALENGSDLYTCKRG